jgi:hypothetical protein
MDVAAANASLDNDYGDSHGDHAPATHYLALFRDTTWDTELTGTAGVDRIPITNNSTNWPDAADGEKTLGATLESDPSTDVWDFDAQAWALMDAATAGNRGDGGELDDPLSVDDVGAVITVDAGSLVVAYETD